MMQIQGFPDLHPAAAGGKMRACKTKEPIPLNLSNSPGEVGLSETTAGRSGGCIVPARLFHSWGCIMMRNLTRGTEQLERDEIQGWVEGLSAIERGQILLEKMMAEDPAQARRIIRRECRKAAIRDRQQPAV
jgi:hypothetical protein